MPKLIPNRSLQLLQQTGSRQAGRCTLAVWRGLTRSVFRTLTRTQLLGKSYFQEGKPNREGTPK